MLTPDMVDSMVSQMPPQFAAIVKHAVYCRQCLAFSIAIATGRIEKDSLSEEMAQAGLCSKGFQLMKPMADAINERQPLQGVPVVTPLTPLPQSKTTEVQNEARRAETLRIMAEIEGENAD